MSRKVVKDNQYSRKILNILGAKAAVSLADLKNKSGPNTLTHEEPANVRYAITRSLKGLREAGLIEQISSPHNEYARLTKEGRKKSIA